MRESPEAESQQSFCHQQIVKLKVSSDLAQLNWSADHLETNTGGEWIQHTRTSKNHSCHVLFGFITMRWTRYWAWALFGRTLEPFQGFFRFCSTPDVSMSSAGKGSPASFFLFLHMFSLPQSSWQLSGFLLKDPLLRERDVQNHSCSFNPFLCSREDLSIIRLHKHLKQRADISCFHYDRLQQILRAQYTLTSGSSLHLKQMVSENKCLELLVIK